MDNRMNKSRDLRNYIGRLIATYGPDAFFQVFSDLAWSRSQAGLPEAGRWRKIFITLQDVLVASRQDIPTPAHPLETPAEARPQNAEASQIASTHPEVPTRHHLLMLMNQIQELIESDTSLTDTDRANLLQDLERLASQLSH